MTTSSDLLDLVKAAILAADTDAGNRVYCPGDWPSQASTVPQIKLRILTENRSALARSGAPQFTTVTTIRAFIEVRSPAIEDDGGASAAEAAVWALKKQVDVAVVNSYPLTSAIQYIPAMRAGFSIQADGAMHVATITMDIDLEFFEGTENFAPVDADDLDGIDLTAVEYPPITLAVDLTE